jgi:hypothetical protein
MSKIILWLGFILSIVLLTYGIFISQSAKLFPIVLWSIIFLGSGYKLFFSPAKR